MNDNAVFKWAWPIIWPLMAALAGGLVAASLPSYRDLTLKGKFAVFGVSFLVSVFIAPAIVEIALPGYLGNSRVVAALYFIIAISGMGIAPKIANLGLRVFGWTDFIFKPRSDQTP